MEDSLFDDITAFLKNSDEGEPTLLSGDDVQTIILGLAASRGDEGFSEDEAIRLIRWCEQQLVGEAMVQLCLKGYAYLDDKSGTHLFDEVSITLSPYGIAAKEKLQ